MAHRPNGIENTNKVKKTIIYWFKEYFINYLCLGCCFLGASRIWVYDKKNVF